MKRGLVFLLVFFYASCHANAQQNPQVSSPRRAATKAQAKTLSIAEVHDIARQVSVLVEERNDQVPGGIRNVGSGVWLAEGFVATCWHVVKDLKGSINIGLGTGGVVTIGTNVIEGAFMGYSATVVASDPDADIAILKTEQNPFKSKIILIKTPTQEIKPKLSVARMNEEDPVVGMPTVLSGYPIAGRDLVSQTGNVAGTGDLNEGLSAYGNPTKRIRILISVVSNPGNSGGPVLNDHGELIGLLEGNWQSPVKDETGTQAVYLRPMKDALGNVLKDAKGNFQGFEAAGMLQNSGISLVVPSRMITPLLKQAEAKK